MHLPGITRRDFLKAVGVTTAMAATGTLPPVLYAGERRLETYPEKADLLLLTARPPQLETPLKYFKELITPNEALFVRWHLANIPTSVDLATWRLVVHGEVENALSLTLDDLKRFEKIEYTAVIQCAGNGRSFFDPPVFGGQWLNGAMGNVTWSGVRLRDVLKRAGIKAGAQEVIFKGLDNPPLPTVPGFAKSLALDKAQEDEIMIAYEMNGRELPLLNGYPVRLVVPGWYATYWVKSLSDMEVAARPFEGFWKKSAYRIPDTACGCVEPGSTPAKTVPITRMTTRSLLINPQDGSRLKAGRPIELMGVAFSGGYGIKEVSVSVNGGQDWRPARLGKDLGRHSWVQWYYPMKPQKAGSYDVRVRAVNSIGESQPLDSLWNPAGYLWNKIERNTLIVV
ncbi:molybdopterin-dependent oxidoreductase [Oryzomonas japonica]|uniref:Molybdopterin-dependent oxidoreductase n=1 Tax=Oryzomonas japonica TaxID=2603858 RepID=A0A7J4ZNT6_9BACT|nr:molybdopterin-dependent oxidoreductase [Oryzomonas japonica]KAB0664431.1 molybdopterin-dependent oxidoreductase [Oryzomonas japonica]